MTVAAIFAGVTSLCLTLWALAGAAIADLLNEPRTRQWFDRAMVGLLIGSAGLILV